MIDANVITDALGKPRPTAEQRAIIESELRPALVVAGAGSGKTETMAYRVLWLLANGHVAPGEVLGLTFTRKAAGELAIRIRERIRQLHATGLISAEYDEFDPPVVATYNSFANTVYRDNAVLIGRDADGPVLGDAAAWQLARQIVIASEDARLAELDVSVDKITEAVLALAHAMSENVVPAAEVSAMARRFSTLAELPSGGRGQYQKDVLDPVRVVGALDILVGLAEEFGRAKAQRSAVEYSDQVALALAIVRKAPRVAAELRGRHRVVLLDEYQDTSGVQTRLLGEIFGGRPVMAVGDPNQSIYGWRGASTGNLDRFAEDFGASSEPHSLSTSWRNDRRILAVANAIARPLAAASRVTIPELVARPNATEGAVDVRYHETIHEEADETAAWLQERLSIGAIPAAVEKSGESPEARDEIPSAAILFRTRATQAVFVDALRARGVPYHVIGIGGLMAEPEVADLVCALRVIDDPGAGSELVRLLAGSRWRIGARDLHALSRLAAWLRDRDYAQRRLDAEVIEKLRASVADGEGGSIVDALDFLARAKEDHTALESFSPTGLERLREAGSVFARLRSRTGWSLVDLVSLVGQELLLDIEIAANETRGSAAAMEAFLDAVNGYLAVSDTGGLSGFLHWLAEADRRESLAPSPEDPEAGTVQLLTIHQAKGLEWDLVVVPRMVDDELPAASREGRSGWLGFGRLPYEFRTDAAELPSLAWRGAATRKELRDRITEFKDAVGDRQLAEERRLAYVAVTRARQSLLLCGSFWAGQKKPRPPSIFLRQLAENGIISPLPAASAAEENPIDGDGETFLWPADPLGGRRERVETAARLVREADPGASGRWQPQIDELLAERRRRQTHGRRVPLPTRVPASRFKDYVADAASVAAAIRRPMPERPYRATRIGTLFHAWVEARSGVSPSSGADVDALGFELDDDDASVTEEELVRLRRTFEHSEFAHLRPVEVEREIHLPFDGRIVVCKIDAVYREGDRYRIVDWKTGAAPTNAADLEHRQLQLALYRLAYAKWAGVPPDAVDAAFYFVADDRVVTPERLYDEDELVRAWREAVTT